MTIIRTAIILAAGESSRLVKYTGGISKVLLDVGGAPLLAIPILSLKKIGVEEFVIVTRPILEKDVRNILSNIDVDFRIVLNKHVKRENGYSLYLGLKEVDIETFFVSMADHIYPPALPNRLLETYNERYDVYIAGDFDPAFIDVGEATKILTDESDNVIKVGKNLVEYNYVDAGVFVMKKDILEVAEYIKTQKYSFSVSDIINTAADLSFSIKVADITGISWMEVDTMWDLKRVLSRVGRELIEHVFDRIDINLLKGDHIWPQESRRTDLYLAT